MIESFPTAFNYRGKPALMTVLRNNGECWGRISFLDSTHKLDVECSRDLYDESDEDAADALIRAARRDSNVSPAIGWNERGGAAMSAAAMTAASSSLRACVLVIQQAQSREVIGRVYEELVGYRLDEDDEQADLESMRDLALGFVREVCDSERIPLSIVGLAPADPLTALMDAPWALPR